MSRNKEFESVRDKLRADFPELSAPGHTLTLPRSLSKLTSDKLSDIMLKYTAWREYTEDLLIDAFVDLTKSNQEYSFAYSKAYVLCSAKNKEEREAKVLAQDDIEELSLKRAKNQMYYDMLGDKLQGIKDTIGVLSREITRRGMLE
jgi:hypothetical protein